MSKYGTLETEIKEQKYLIAALGKWATTRKSILTGRR